MNKTDVLIEIGTEEIPARFVEQTAVELKQKMTEWFESNRIDVNELVWYATPRRLVVIAFGVDVKQQDISKEVRGPAKRIALDDSGKWTKAAHGFARGQNVSVDDLYFKEHNGDEYVFVRKVEAGRATNELLAEDVSDLVTSLSFPKSMRWGSGMLRFIRPIRWIVALFGSEIMPVEIAGVQATNKTRGHRFLGEDTIIEHPSTYVEALAKQFVIVDPEERKSLILQQLQKLQEENRWHIPIDKRLLEEIVYLVEFPIALVGSFDEEFLDIPNDILITAMREHQRYFPVMSTTDNRLLPYFVTVRNGDDTSIETVRKGNEKVIRARLADARFFYEEDRSKPLSHFNEKLENVVFHEQLGTIMEKVRRIRSVSVQLARLLQLSDRQTQHVERTAELCKFDLVTNVVNEFPELQGRMGEIYARCVHEDEEVARGIFEHYLPRYAGDTLPETVCGQLVSLVDKMDTIAACFGVGIVPTGSEDPYALRRQAAGIMQILVSDADTDITLTRLIALALDELEKNGRLERPRPQIEQDLAAFFELRLKHILETEGIRYDVANAVLESGIESPRLVIAKAKVLTYVVEQAPFKDTVEAFTRVYNLARKYEGDVTHIEEERLLEESERDLYQSYQQAARSLEEAEANGNAEEMYRAINQLPEKIHAFFNDVMVMVDDEQLRTNRLVLLGRVSDLIHRFAYFNHIVV